MACLDCKLLLILSKLRNTTHLGKMSFTPNKGLNPSVCTFILINSKTLALIYSILLSVYLSNDYFYLAREREREIRRNVVARLCQMVFVYVLSDNSGDFNFLRFLFFAIFHSVCSVHGQSIFLLNHQPQTISRFTGVLHKAARSFSFLFAVFRS